MNKFAGISFKEDFWEYRDPWVIENVVVRNFFLFVDRHDWVRKILFVFVAPFIILGEFLSG